CICSVRDMTLTIFGSYSRSWRTISEPIEPVPPVTNTVFPSINCLMRRFSHLYPPAWARAASVFPQPDQSRFPSREPFELEQHSRCSSARLRYAQDSTG